MRLPVNLQAKKEQLLITTDSYGKIFVQSAVDEHCDCQFNLRKKTSQTHRRIFYDENSQNQTEKITKKTIEDMMT